MSERMRPIAQAMHEVLRPAGFRRQRHAWRRDAGEFVDIVNLQLSKGLDSVWVNLGVIQPDAYQWTWAMPVGSTVDEARCTVRSRLGVLVDGHDTDWDVGDADSPVVVADLLRSVGLPWLEGMHSLAALQLELERTFAAQGKRAYVPVAIALAVVHWKQSDIPAACRTLDARRRWELGPWEDRLVAVSRELACPPATESELG
jgi:hypothetical protein